jgi:hypothetical protein
MYFDLAPKSRKADLYDFETELRELEKGLKYSRIVLILGPRRTGKSSVLLTFLHEHKVPHVLLDVRKMAAGRELKEREFMLGLGEAIQIFLEKQKSKVRKLRERLEEIRGLKVTGSSIEIAWGKRQRPSLANLLESLNVWAERHSTRVVLAIDEAQELRSLIQFRFPNLLAHAYDYMKNLVLCLTGSQVGLLYDFLKLEDPKAPLYGRPVFEIKLRRLTGGEAEDFLKKGFEQTKVKVSQAFLREAVEKLDGITGWLTYCGWYASYKRPSIERILDEASKLATAEVGEFLSRSRSPRRYSEILNLLAATPLPWSGVKRGLEASEGMEMDGSTFTNLLETLVKLGFIEKEGDLYRIADPMLQHGLLRK